MEIRPFTPSDIGAIIELWKKCGLTTPQNDPWRDIERKMRVDPELLLVGVDGGRVIATVMAGYEGHRGWINYAAVHPDHRRRGHGRTMMAAAEQALAALNCPKINLQVRRSNEQVVAFYRSLGYATDDVISLGKRLAADEKPADETRRRQPRQISSRKRTMIQNLDRYHRQMLLPGFGEDGQRKLLGSSALIVGCGALGTVIANMLARAGVGHLIIVDRDFIEMTNLQRQVLFDEADVANAIPKAQAAKNKINGINSDVTVTAVVEDVNHANMEKLALGGYSQGVWAGKPVDVIVDGVDNFETRYLANDCAVKHGIPYVYGGAVGTVGASYAVLPHTEKGDAAWETAETPNATPCLRCIFEQAPPPGLNPTCDTAGVIGPAVSIVSNYQVAETLKILTGNLDRVSPTMLNLDLWANTFRQFKVAKAYDVGDCRCCKHRTFEFLDGKFGSSTTTLCGRNAVQITNKPGSGPSANGKLDFVEIGKRLEAHGTVKVNKFMLRADITDNGEPYELTLFTDGRAIVKGTKHANVAKSVYAKYVGA